MPSCCCWHIQTSWCFDLVRKETYHHQTFLFLKQKNLLVIINMFSLLANNLDNLLHIYLLIQDSSSSSKYSLLFSLSLGSSDELLETLSDSVSDSSSTVEITKACMCVIRNA